MPQDLTTLQALLPLEAYSENVSLEEVWRILLENVKKHAQEPEGNSGITWNEVAKFYAIARQVPKNINQQSLEFMGTALDRLFETEEYKRKEQNLSTLQELIPEVAVYKKGKTVTEENLWRVLLEKVKKPTGVVSWTEIAQIYGIARSLPDGFDRQKFLRIGSAIDHLFQTEEYKTKAQNLSTLQEFIPEGVVAETGEYVSVEMMWQSLLEKVRKPEGIISWTDIARLYGIARKFPGKFDQQSFLRAGSAIDHLFKTKEYGSMPQNLSTMQALIPEIHPVRVGKSLPQWRFGEIYWKKLKNP